MKKLALSFAGLLFLVSCATNPLPSPAPKPAPTPSPFPSPLVTDVQVQADQAAVAGPRRRVDALQIVRSQIPPPLDSNCWVVLTFPNVSSANTVYQRGSLTPGIPWLIATNSSTNKVMFLLNKTILSRFYTVTANVATNSTASVTLAWDKSFDPSVAGYNIYGGTKSGNYTNKYDAGNVTNTVIYGLKPGVVNYFVATTYSTLGLESAFSSEVSYASPTISWGLKTSIALFPLVPTITVLSATNVMSTSAVVRGQVVDTGGNVPITMFFYGLMDAVANTNGYWTSIAIAGTSTNLVSTVLTNLVPNTKYYYVFAAVNAAGLSITVNDLSFSTTAALALLTPRAKGAVRSGLSMQKLPKIIVAPPIPVLPPAPAPPPLPPVLKQTKTNSFFLLNPPTELRQVIQ